MIEKFSFKNESKAILDNYSPYFKNKHLKMLLLGAVLFFANQDSQAQTSGNLIKKEKIENENSKLDSLNKVYMEEYKNNFQQIKEIFKENNIESIVNNLKDKFGNSINDFLSLHHINQDIDNFHKVDNNQNSDKVFVDKSYFFQTHGSLLSKAYRERWSDNQLENKNDSLNITVEGIEGISSTEVLDYIKKKYPKGYVQNSIRAIEYIPQVNDPEHNIIKIGEAENFGISSMVSSTGDMRSKIDIYNIPQGIDKNMFYSILDHEINHPNDWNNSKVLNSQDRILMLNDFLHRVEDSQRYKSDYVEGISLDNLQAHFKENNTNITETEMEQTLLYIKTLEYFAEVVKAYFFNPEEFKKNNLEDYVIVKKWVDRITYLNNK